MPIVESHGLEIHYETRGEGPAVLLLHSFLCSGEMWRHQIEPLATHHRLINVDLRGHGRSDPVSQPCGLDDLVDDAVAVLDDLGIDRATWMGLSIGGMISLRAALRFPDRVSALILLDTDAGPETVPVRVKYAVLGLLARLFGLAPVRGPVVRQMFGATTRRRQLALVDEWSDRFSQVDVPSALRILDGLVARKDLTPRLDRIRVPALVVVGEEDTSLPPERSRRLAAGLADAELVEIPGAGHLSALERPELVNPPVLDFLHRRVS